MATFTYRLQPLLDQKTRLKEEAAEILSEKQQQLRTANDKLNDLLREEKHLADKKALLRRNLLSADSLAGLDIQRRTEYLKAIGLDLESAKDAVFTQKMHIDDCDRQVKEAKANLSERSRDEEVLLKHREKLRTRFAREVERREALEQDEIGNMMHARSQQS